MKAHLIELIQSSLVELKKDGVIEDDQVNIQIDRTRDPSHGDYACNIAMILAKQAKRKPRELADLPWSRSGGSCRDQHEKMVG